MRARTGTGLASGMCFFKMSMEVEPEVTHTFRPARSSALSMSDSERTRNFWTAV